MEFSLKHTSADRIRSACVVVGLYDDGSWAPSALAIDKAASGHLTALLRRDDLKGKAGSCALLHAVPGIAAARVAVVGLGKKADLSTKAFREAAAAGLRAAASSGANEAMCFSAEWDTVSMTMADRIMHTVLVAADGAYRFDHLKSKKDASAAVLDKVGIGLETRPGAAETRALVQAAALGEGVSLAKDLGNLPSNICTPAYLAQTARDLGKAYGFKTTVLERRDMEKLGMGSFLSVTKGSQEPPKFIVMEYSKGRKKDKPVVLVGKGITFDTGGISLKPSAEMDEMKYDMSGAGSVLGTFKAVAAMDLPINVVGLIPACENMPSGTATKPGDIVTSMSGQTIEILNTDAEGRLILCDALTYAERYQPAAVIDIATLTGACVIALGHVVTGMFANKDALAEELEDTGKFIWDRVWHMPMLDDYQEQIKSPFADMANIGGRPGGSVTAACFLSRYAGAYPWAHLDIAGTAWKSGKDKGSTGRPVPLLTAFLMRRAMQ
ncbi:MAG: leucyl aminopeptidase [Betaproteobacteria bacterium]|nr:leucyl aminopeptidase [Betaproteobacteria bacterium]